MPLHYGVWERVIRKAKEARWLRAQMVSCQRVKAWDRQTETDTTCGVTSGKGENHSVSGHEYMHLISWWWQHCSTGIVILYLKYNITMTWLHWSMVQTQGQAVCGDVWSLCSWPVWVPGASSAVGTHHFDAGTVPNRFQTWTESCNMTLEVRSTLLI